MCVCLSVCTREWTKLQMAEKQHRADEESFANRLYSMKARELDERLVDLAIAEERTRRELNMATKGYNLVQVCVCVGGGRLSYVTRGWEGCL